MKQTPKKPLILLCAFLLPALTMTAVFALCGIAPFGSRSMSVLDMANQYLSILSSLRDVVTGKISPLYLPSMALGGNMAGVLAYYLMSPLNLLLCLFSKESLILAVGLLYILRVGLCGLTMGIYAGARHGWSWRVLFPAMAYSLMAYMVAYSTNYLWLDSVALLPLVALGIARLIEARRWVLYTVSLAAALIFSFYIGYILCIFSVMFFLAELLSTPELRKSRPVRSMVDFALASLASGALAAVVLIPTFLSLQGGKAGFSLDSLSLTANFSFPALFSKLFPGAFNYNELTEAGLPNIFTGTVTMALAVLYFASRSVPRRRKAALGCLLGALVVSFFVSALDLVWHGMNVPTWNNYRYSFLFSFLLAAAADEALVHLKDTRPWQLLLPVGAAALMGVLAFAGRSYSFVTWRSALAAVGVTALVCGGIWLALRPKTAPKVLAGLAAALLLVHTADLALNAKRTMDELLGTSSDPAAWAAYVHDKDAAMALADTGDTFIRVESPDSFAQNRAEPMLFNYDGLTHYSSNVSLKNLEFLKSLGFACFKNAHALYTAGITAGADSLLGVGYVVTEGMHKDYAPVGSFGRYTAYVNPYALPIGWTADAAMEEPVQGADCFDTIQGIFAASAPEVGQALYIPAEITDVALDGLADGGDGAYVLDGTLGGDIIYTVVPQADGPLYGFMDIPDFPGVMVFTNDAYTAYYATGQTNGSLYLGDFAAGETVTVRVQTALDITVSQVSFVTEDVQALAAYHDAIMPGGCSLTKLSNAHFTGAFTTGEGDALLVLTIPYDKGWSITLDGESVQAHEVQNCLTAIPVTAGEHTLDMRYTPPGLIPGAAVSAIAVLVCLGVYFVGKRKAK